MLTHLRNLLGTILLFAFLCGGCAVNRQYKEAVADNSITTYEAFLLTHPKGKRSMDVAKRIAVLREAADWKKALRLNDWMNYDSFIDRYPQSVHVSEAEKNIASLKLEAAWFVTRDNNTIAAYEAFIASQPYSQYTPLARDAIVALKHEARWRQVEQSRSITVLEDFIAENPLSRFIDQAKTLLTQFKLIAPAWDKASAENTIVAYKAFLRQYPASDQARNARERIAKLDLDMWQQAQDRNTIYAYQAYLTNLPDGNYADRAEERIETLLWDHAVRSNSTIAYQAYLDQAPLAWHVNEAKKKLIDLEVDAIFKGDHGQLPPMSRAGSSFSRATTSDVEIFNDTEYTLTVRYSGAESQRIILQPQHRSTTNLPNGNYRITASVNAADVTNYAGKEDLIGGDYESKYYIVREWPQGRR